MNASGAVRIQRRNMYGTNNMSSQREYQGGREQSLEAKIVVLGSQGVGKTSLCHRYVKNSFLPAEMTSTVGASFQTKKVVDDESDTVVRLQIWDTAGQERFRSISRLYYRGANACILCYSITDLSSFLEMGLWLSELRKNLDPGAILHVVGTKADLVARDPSLRQVPFERCIAYVAENLAPGMSSTPPPTAGANISASVLDSGTASAASGGLRSFLAGGIGGSGDGARSPSSKRSSGFWGQEIGWDCCHEVSAESGEGVEEVFRVITRKLVEQDRIVKEALASAVQSPGLSLHGEGDYFEGATRRPGGSFRVGRDRRSWFGVPVETYVDVGQGDGQEEQVKTRRKCC